MVRTQVQFTEEQIAAFRVRAAREDVSVSELVRRAVEAWVTTEMPWREKKRRAQAVAGRFRSGQSGIARDHDEHLAAGFGS